ncbi:MAG TPA: sigma-54 dependent transcriptional regulator, partial [Kofleriaceae bacterium]|nr:sigma-54 dependent transcriptional regulator [Kofleriaceae bacterium]
MPGQLLVVDDDVASTTLLVGALQRRGYTVDSVSSAQAALEWLSSHACDVVLADLHLEGMSGAALCGELRTTHPEVLTIVITGDVSLSGAVAAIRVGAYDYINKPIDLDALVLAIERAIGHVTLGRELRELRSSVAASRPIANIIGNSPAMARVLEIVHKVADSETSVLIVGESGTGKELIARALHEASSRREQPFAAINCAAVPPGLLESELFGHVTGAFTDARRSRPGLFVQAHGGTIFLDEIGEMPPEMQVKLLRVLQERKVRPIGGEEEIAFDARVVAATNRDLESDVAEKHFRSDLYYRINVVQIALPPLRARAGDILLLAQHFIEKINARCGKGVVGISPDAARAMIDYDWPGNVRELENSLERAIALSSTTELQVSDLPDKIREHRRGVLAVIADTPEALITLAEVERRYVRQVLAAVGGNKTMAAKVLGIDRRSLYRRLDDDQIHRVAPPSPASAA